MAYFVGLDMSVKETPSIGPVETLSGRRIMNNARNRVEL